MRIYTFVSKFVDWPIFSANFLGLKSRLRQLISSFWWMLFTVWISHHVGEYIVSLDVRVVLLIALVDACSDWLGWWQMGVWKALQGFPTKSAAIKLAMKGKKWAIKAVILGRSLTGDRLAECAWVSLTYLDVDRNCRPNVIAQENSTLLWVGMKMLTTGVIMLRW